MCGRYYVAIDDDDLREIGEEAERIASGLPEPVKIKTSGEIFPTDVVPVKTAAIAGLGTGLRVGTGFGTGFGTGVGIGVGAAVGTGVGTGVGANAGLHGNVSAGLHIDAGKAMCVPMKWGFVSFDKKLIINARSETVMQKPMFIKPMQENRCLIPASGYFEWKKVEAAGRPDSAAGIGGEDYSSGAGGAGVGTGAGGAGADGKKRIQKIKYRFYVPGRPIYLAGCYRAEKDSPLYHFVILTRQAANGLDEFHDRMPVIIPEAHIDAWLYEGAGAIKSALLELEYALAA